MPIRTRLMTTAAGLLLLAAGASVILAGRSLGSQPGTPRSGAPGPVVLAPAQIGLLRHTGIPPTAGETALLAVLAQRGVPAREIGGTTWVRFLGDVLGQELPAGDGRWVRTDLGVLDAAFVGDWASSIRVCAQTEGHRYAYRVTAGRGGPAASARVGDANRVLFFTVIGGTVTVTDSAQLNDSLLRVDGAASVPC